MTELAVSIRRFHFAAREPVRFPDGKASNVLRGGFGLALRSTAEPGLYARIFEPKAATGPSGMADPPRPYLFRAAHLDGLAFPPEGDFHFDVHWFGEPSGLDAVTQALDRMFADGAGVGRGRARLASIEDRRISLGFTAAETAQRVRVTFLTPTELKHEGRIAQQPDFAILLRRARDRVSALLSLYGPGELEMDFRLFGEAVRQIRLLRSQIGARALARTSGRTGQTHEIGGMLGEADFEGELGPFLPFLRAAYYTGVGRHTVWGNGWIGCEILTP